MSGKMVLPFCCLLIAMSGLTAPAHAQKVKITVTPLHIKTPATPGTNTGGTNTGTHLLPYTNEKFIYEKQISSQGGAEHEISTTAGH